MSRFLFVVPPLAGHIHPAMAVAAALHGHEVAWVGHPSALAARLPPGARLYPVSEHDPEARVHEATLAARQVRGAAALKVLWEDILVPLGRSMRPFVEAAIDDFAPDVVVSDQQALAGPLAARCKGVRWATSCTTSAAVVDPLVDMPQVYAWREGLLRDLQIEAGLEPWPTPDRSPDLVIVFSTEALIGRPLGPPNLLVGPAFGPRVDAPFPWDRLASTRRVLVSLGTLNAERGGRFFEAVVDGLGGTDVQVLLVAPEGVVPPLPDNVLRFDRVPQLDLLPHVDAVVSHAGHNTVCEALAHGKPLVVAPITDDQPVVAGQVEAAGAGVRVRFGRVRGPALRDAVRAVLDDPTYARNAARIGDSFRAAGGAEAAARALVDLVQ